MHIEASKSLEDYPIMKIVQRLLFVGGVNYATKYARTWELIDSLASKSIWNS